MWDNKESFYLDNMKLSTINIQTYDLLGTAGVLNKDFDETWSRFSLDIYMYVNSNF